MDSPRRHGGHGVRNWLTLVPKLCLGTHFSEALLRMQNKMMDTITFVANEAELRQMWFPNRVWEPGYISFLKSTV